MNNYNLLCKRMIQSQYYRSTKIFDNCYKLLLSQNLWKYDSWIKLDINLKTIDISQDILSIQILAGVCVCHFRHTWIKNNQSRSVYNRSILHLPLTDAQNVHVGKNFAQRKHKQLSTRYTVQQRIKQATFDLLLIA